MAVFRRLSVSKRGAEPSKATIGRNRAAATKLLTHHTFEEASAMLERAFDNPWFVREQACLWYWPATSTST